MSSFLRIAGAAALFLSLGLFVRATPIGLLSDVPLVALPGTDLVSCALNKIIVEGDIVAKIKACLDVATVADLKIKIDLCVAIIKACADELLKIGVVANLDVKAKADIVACIAALITLFVKVCLQLTLKFGVAAVATILAEIDVCLKALLVSLNVCIDGIVALIVKALLSVTISLLPQLNFNLCTSLITGAGALVGAGVNAAVTL